MKIKCSNCDYIFEIETGVGEEFEDIVLCPNCNNNIIISKIKEYNEKDEFEYINTNEWKIEKNIIVSLKSTRLLITAIISIGISLFYIYHSTLININIIIFSIFFVIGFCLLIL